MIIITSRNPTSQRSLIFLTSRFARAFKAHFIKFARNVWREGRNIGGRNEWKGRVVVTKN